MKEGMKFAIGVKAREFVTKHRNNLDAADRMNLEGMLTDFGLTCYSLTEDDVYHLKPPSVESEVKPSSLKEMLVEWLSEQYSKIYAREMVENAKIERNGDIVKITYENKVVDEVTILGNKVVHYV